jgi:hypothetical protein
MKSGAALAFAATLLASEAASASPQWNASALTGICGLGAESSYWQRSCWYNGLRADVLFGRSRDSDFAIGPFTQLATAGFDDLRLSGGGSFLIPATSYFPLVLSASGYARHEDAWTPGISGWLFFGSRSYNFHSSYVMAGGLLFGIEHDVGGPKQNAIFVGAQIDGLILALPFIAAYQWIKGRDESND